MASKWGRRALEEGLTNSAKYYNKIPHREKCPFYMFLLKLHKSVTKLGKNKTCCWYCYICWLVCWSNHCLKKKKSKEHHSSKWHGLALVFSLNENNQYIYGVFFAIFPNSKKNQNRLVNNSLQRYNNPNLDLAMKIHSNFSYWLDLPGKIWPIKNVPAGKAKAIAPKCIWVDFFFLFNYVLIQGRVSRSVMITIETEQYSNGKCKEHLLPKQKSLYQGLSIKHSLL